MEASELGREDSESEKQIGNLDLPEESPTDSFHHISIEHDYDATLPGEVKLPKGVLENIRQRQAENAKLRNELRRHSISFIRCRNNVIVTGQVMNDLEMMSVKHGAHLIDLIRAIPMGKTGRGSTTLLATLCRRTRCGPTLKLLPAQLKLCSNRFKQGRTPRQGNAEF